MLLTHAKDTRIYLKPLYYKINTCQRYSYISKTIILQDQHTLDVCLFCFKKQGDLFAILKMSENLKCFLFIDLFTLSYTQLHYPLTVSLNNRPETKHVTAN